jgi:hypothetical protein
MKKNAPKAARKASKAFVLGRVGFEKISAVEGIRFPASLKKTFRELDRAGSSAAERRRAIAGKYGKTSA